MILVLVLVGIVAFMLLRGASATKNNDLGSISDFFNQKELDVSPTQTQIGAVGLSEGRSDGNSSVDENKLNVITTNLVTEDGLRKIINDALNVSQVNTQTTAGTETRSVKGLEVFKDENSRIVVENAFKPIGKSIVINPNTVKNVKPREFSKGFVGRDQPFFQVTTVRDGKIKTRFGSEALVKRLQSNALSNSIR